MSYTIRHVSVLQLPQLFYPSKKESSFLDREKELVSFVVFKNR